ncbi:MAG TPA: MCE family protein [Actinomycetota bacterium]|nr:MCE family protein [Actinomycetota bacterium]
MRVTRRVIIRMTAFIVGAIALVYILALQILPTVVGSTYTISGIFPEAGGVFTAQEITYRGVQIGRVGAMTLTRNAVKIEMIIDSKYKVPADGTRAEVLYKSAVGEQFIDLVPSGVGPPYLEQGDVIGRERTQIPIQTEDLLRHLDGLLRSVDARALGVVVHELGTALADHGEDLEKILLALDTLSAIGAERKNEIAGGIEAGSSLQRAFNATSEDFVSGAGSLSEIATILGKRRAELKATLDATESLDRSILRLLQDRETDIKDLIANLGSSTRALHEQRPQLDLTLQFLAPFLNDAYRAYRAPYFVFNLVKNSENKACAYEPSSEHRPITEVNPGTFGNPEDPQTDFACRGGDPPEAGSSMTRPAKAVSWPVDQRGPR